MAHVEVEGYKRRILSMLIKKYEKSQSFQAGTPGKQRPQLAMAGSGLAEDYFDEMDYRKREWIHAALHELSQEGIVEVSWPKLKRGVEVEKIYLNFEGVEQAYQVTGTVPKEGKIRQLSEILAPLAQHPWEWVRSWREESNVKLQERKPAGLDLDDLSGYRDLVRVLLALPDLEESTPKRVISQNLFHDSKRFEQGVERRLINLLKRIYPEELDKDEDYLDQVGIVENPKLTLLAGPLIIGSGDRQTELDLNSLPGGCGLSAESVSALEIRSIYARTILLVENLTTYYEVIRTPEVLPAPVLVIYTGGFPHKATQKLLRKISGFLKENRSRATVQAVYHWGDIDYGGIRIFEYIKRNFFPTLQPYRMDVATYRAFVPNGLLFGEEQAAKLERLLADMSCEEWHPVIQELLKHRKRVEQESIR